MAEQDQAKEKQLAISKIYIKDSSFESPLAPLVFKRNEWNPQTNLNLRSSHNAVEGNVHEIVLTFARENIASMVQKGGFPEFLLQPINFDALYAQSRQQQAAEPVADAEKH